MKKKNTKLKRFIADSIGTGIFWTIAYIPVYLYTAKTFRLAMVGLLFAAILEIALGGLFGKFLDRFREIFIH